MKNSVGVFPANHMKKFIDFKSMILKNLANILFQLRILAAQIKTVHTGGAYLTLNQKMTGFLFYSFEVDELKYFITQDVESVIQKHYLELKK